MTFLYYVAFIFIFGTFISEILSHNKYSYKAAVLEYSPNFTHGTEDITVFQKSVADFTYYIEKAASQNVDIIVFPEGGLTASAPRDRKRILRFSTEIPDPADSIAPCYSTKFAQHLKNISCAAALNKIYVAISLVELYNCTGKAKCSDDGIFIYNTYVVFDREGIVLARYRKYNLFVEPGFDITDEPEFAIFETDFNVTFGMFVCFDILFQEPALKLVRTKHIHDFIYSASWLSELPFLTAVQTQAGWAYSNKVTLLASGYDYPIERRGGSGLHFGRMGALAQVFPLFRMNVMLTAKIPKYPFYNDTNLLEKPFYTNSTLDEMVLGQEDLRNYTTKIIRENNFAEQICDNNLCCYFKTNMSVISSERYIYRAVVIDGIRTYPDLVQGGLQVCGIVNCLNETIESCGLRYRTKRTGLIFHSIKISGNFQQNEKTFQFPSTLNSHLLPLDPKLFKYGVSHHSIEMNLEESVGNLLTFAIHGRNYTLDKRIHK